MFVKSISINFLLEIFMNDYQLGVISRRWDKRDGARLSQFITEKTGGYFDFYRESGSETASPVPSVSSRMNSYGMYGLRPVYVQGWSFGSNDFSFPANRDSPLWHHSVPPGTVPIVT